MPGEAVPKTSECYRNYFSEMDATLAELWASAVTSADSRRARFPKTQKCAHIVCRDSGLLRAEPEASVITGACLGR
jgi:hypothetical protein